MVEESHDRKDRSRDSIKGLEPEATRSSRKAGTKEGRWSAEKHREYRRGKRAGEWER